MYFKPWEELTIGDDYIFKRIMQQVQICKHFLEMLLGITIREIRYLDSEKSIKAGYASKGVRLDVYVADEKDTVYNIEMQVAALAHEIIGKRSRYYQSMLDADLLAAGVDYDQLNRTIIIFVCRFDPFGRGRHIYTFRSRCEEEASLLLGDEATKIFLNTNGTVGDISDDLKAFLAYIDGELNENPFVQEVDLAIQKLKVQEQERVNYMTWEIKMNEMRKEGRAEGIQKATSIFRALMGKKPYDEIAQIEGTTVEEVRRIAEESGLAY